MKKEIEIKTFSTTHDTSYALKNGPKLLPRNIELLQGNNPFFRSTFNKKISVPWWV